MQADYDLPANHWWWGGGAPIRKASLGLLSQLPRGGRTPHKHAIPERVNDFGTPGVISLVSKRV
jgi:hypothetical protein